MNDLKFAFRQLFKNPGFTAVAASARIQLADCGAWEFFAGLEDSGLPRWTANIAARAAVFRNRDACLRSAMTYNAGFVLAEPLPSPDSPPAKPARP